METYQAIIYSANGDLFQNLLGSFTYNFLGHMIIISLLGKL